MRGFIGKVRLILDMIGFEHTIFALPFALIGMLLASRGLPGGLQGRVLAWILVARVGARSAPMSFNRLADAEIDARNPRTAKRHIPAGLIDRVQVWLFLALSVAVFLVAAWQLNPLCLALSPL